MKDKRYNKYKKMRRKILSSASTGIVTGMIIMGAGTAYADTIDYSSPSYKQEQNATGMHMMHRWNSTTKANSLALQLGLDPEEVKLELKTGKTLKQILQDHGIVPGQLQKAFENSSSRRYN